jgi:hypothetical protein
VVLLHNMRRCVLFMNPTALACPPPSNRKINAKRRDVARSLRHVQPGGHGRGGEAGAWGGDRVSLRINTDFHLAITGLREHHQSACWYFYFFLVFFLSLNVYIFSFKRGCASTTNVRVGFFVF